MSFLAGFQPSRFKKISFITLSALLWLLWAMSFDSSFEVTSHYFYFLFLGIIGAIFANTTGAGGGVVFIPIFNSLELSELQALSTSFAIQCFGMTAGTLTWWRYYKDKVKHHSQLNANDWSQYPIILKCCIPASIAGLWLCQFTDLQPPQSMPFTFGVFSIVLGVILGINCIYRNQRSDRRLLSKKDLYTIVFISFLGGIITGWLSVGVGELVVIYLLLKRTAPIVAIAAGVTVSAATVWASAYIHFTPSAQTYFQIVLFAGPGAILGGLLARRIVTLMSVKNLKLVFSCWIIASGIFMLLL